MTSEVGKGSLRHDPPAAVAGDPAGAAGGGRTARPTRCRSTGSSRRSAIVRLQPALGRAAARRSSLRDRDPAAARPRRLLGRRGRSTRPRAAPSSCHGRDERVGLVVDRLIGQQELVTRPLPAVIDAAARARLRRRRARRRPDRPDRRHRSHRLPREGRLIPMSTEPLYTDMQLSAIQEIANIGTGNAATALAQMIGGVRRHRPAAGGVRHARARLRAPRRAGDPRRRRPDARGRRRAGQHPAGVPVRRRGLALRPARHRRAVRHGPLGAAGDRQHPDRRPT